MAGRTGIIHAQHDSLLVLLLLWLLTTLALPSGSDWRYSAQSETTLLLSFDLLVVLFENRVLRIGASLGEFVVIVPGVLTSLLSLLLEGESVGGGAVFGDIEIVQFIVWASIRVRMVAYDARSMLTDPARRGSVNP